MSILEILLLGIGLSMDAFAVSICKGLSTKKLQFKHYLIIGFLSVFLFAVKEIRRLFAS